MPVFGVFSMIFWYVMPFVGLGATVALAAFKLAPKLPWKWGQKFAGWHMSKALATMGSDVALVRTVDGHYTLAPATYDPENAMLWVNYGEEEKGYDVNGIGHTSLPFFGVSLSLVYEDLGAVTDLASAKLGRLAKHNYDAQRPEIDVGEEDGPRARKEGTEGVPALADGGAEPDELERDEVMVPTSGVVSDLRNVMNLAPFHVRPSAMKRVEKNAKAGLQGFSDWGPIAQTGGMLAAFFMGGLLVWFVTGDGGGGGGGAAESVSVNALALLAAAAPEVRERW